MYPGLGPVTLGLGLSLDGAGSFAPDLLGFIAAGAPLLVAAMFLKRPPPARRQ